MLICAVRSNGIKEHPPTKTAIHLLMSCLLSGFSQTGAHGLRAGHLSPFSEALRMIEMARSPGLKTKLGCMISSSVAITAAAHLSRSWITPISMATCMSTTIRTRA
jgi:hypothetical protein